MEYSAGIIPFRRNSDGQVEFFVGHPGGVEGDESWEECALREFREESGLKLEGIGKKDLIPLGTSKQNKHKIVIAFALYYPDIDTEKCFSNVADNGLYPEIDKYAWMTFNELKEKTHHMHINFYEQIIDMVS